MFFRVGVQISGVDDSVTIASFVGQVLENLTMNCDKNGYFNYYDDIVNNGFLSHFMIEICIAWKRLRLEYI